MSDHHDALLAMVKSADSALAALRLERDAAREALARVEAERDGLRALLDEASDWLCSHPGAKEFIAANPDMRFWCGECQNYVRSPEQATLVERIAAALSQQPDTGKGE